MVKIELANNTKINDIINGHFTLYGKPFIYMESPKENLTVEDKTNYKINWQSKNIRENRINLFYSINSGLNWNLIASDISNKGYYNWFIPTLGTAKAIFKVESTIQREISSISNYTLSITEKPLIIIKNNLNDLTFSLNDSINLIWESYNLSDQYIDILYSDNSGKNWIVLFENIIDSGQKNISIPFIANTSSNCKIKIIDSNNTRNFSVSSGLFAINRPRGEIILLTNNNKYFDYSDQIDIKWNNKYMSDKKGKIYYSLDNGINWKIISEVNISDNYFKWDIPNLEFGSNQCLIKIAVDNYSNYDFLDDFGKFKINPAPFISIVNNNKDTVKTNMSFEIKIKTKI